MLKETKVRLNKLSDIYHTHGLVESKLLHSFAWIQQSNIILVINRNESSKKIVTLYVESAIVPTWPCQLISTLVLFSTVLA